jgi:hypothetical protein
MAESDVERAAAPVTTRSAPVKHQTTRLELNSLPSDVADALKHFDSDGDGLITTAVRHLRACRPAVPAAC